MTSITASTVVVNNDIEFMKRLTEQGNPLYESFYFLAEGTSKIRITMI